MDSFGHLGSLPMGIATADQCKTVAHPNILYILSRNCADLTGSSLKCGNYQLSPTQGGPIIGILQKRPVQYCIYTLKYLYAPQSRPFAPSLAPDWPPPHATEAAVANEIAFSLTLLYGLIVHTHDSFHLISMASTNHRVDAMQLQALTNLFRRIASGVVPDLLLLLIAVGMLLTSNRDS